MVDASSKHSNSYHDNFETFSLIWLDNDVNKTESNQQTQKQLRQIINHLKVFNDLRHCYNYIMSISAQDRLILIVSGQLGRQLVPQIHHLRQISSIYIFCMDKEANDQWAQNYTKIKRVIVSVEDLLDQIKANHHARGKIEEPLSIKICHDNQNLDQSTTTLGGQCVYSFLLIDVLIRMKSTENDKHELIKFCKDVYKHNHAQLVIINEFEREYTSHQALWWYTRESFVYRMLNKALRVHNIELLYLFRFLIRDIYQLLRQNQYRSSIHVYRGQVMCKNELNMLEQSLGKLISINSFFSTSTNREKAVEFVDDFTDLHRVLFVIDADHREVKSRPFANISKFSSNAGESEVLFMAGCVFRVLEIDQNTQGIWIIRMRLFDDNQHSMKTLFNHLKKEYGCTEDEVSLQSFGNLLHCMGENDLAEKMYNRVLPTLSSNDPAYVELCYSFGEISKDRNEYDISLHWFKTSLEIQMRIDPSNYIFLGSVYCCIGNVQMGKGNGHEAIKCYTKAIDLYNQAHTTGHQGLLASAYHGIADIYRNQKNYSEALHYYVRALSLQEQYLPPEHSDMAITVHSIGDIYYHSNQYDKAMSHYEQSLKIRQNSLPSEHLDIAKSFKSIGSVYERLKEWTQALEYYQQANAIYHHSSSSSSQQPVVNELRESIERISLQLY